METIKRLNDKIESKTDGEHGPRHAAKNTRREAQEAASHIGDIDDGGDQAAALGLVHYAALRHVLRQMATDSLAVDFSDWSKTDLEEQFTARQLYELLRVVRRHQSWASDLRKRQTAHMIRTGFCGSAGEDHVDEAEDGVYHPYEEDYLRILHAESATDCQGYDERFADRAWTNDDGADTDATESTDTDSGSESDEPSGEVNRGSQDAECGDLAASMSKLIESKVSEKTEQLADDSSCDCNSHTEEEIREIVRDEMSRVLSQVA